MRLGGENVLPQRHRARYGRKADEEALSLDHARDKRASSPLPIVTPSPVVCPACPERSRGKRSRRAPATWGSGCGAPLPDFLLVAAGR